MIKKITSKFGSLASYGLIYTISSSFQKGIGFLVFMYFANILTTTEYAKFGLNYSMFTIISALTYSGILEAVVSLMSAHKNDNLRALLRGANTVFILLTIISFIITSFMVWLFYSDDFDNISDFLFILLAAGLSSFFVFQSIIIRLEEKHLLSITLSFLPALLGYLGGYIAVLFFRSGSSYFLGTCIGVALSTVILLPFIKNKINGFSLDKLRIVPIFYRITPYIIISIVAWVLGYGNTFLIKYLFDDLQVALFVFLFTISSILQLVANSMNQVWSPRFFNNYGTETINVIESKYRKFTNIQGLVIGFTGLSIILIAPFILNHFEKLSKFGDSDYQMFFLFAGYVVSIPWWHYQNYFMINDKGRLLMNLTLISGIIGYVAWILCMLFLGKMGIYIGFFVQMMVKSMIVYFSAKRYWKVQLDWIGLSIGIGLLVASLLIVNLY